MSEICVLRLTTGEDVIAKVDTDGHEYELHTPMNLVFDPASRGCHMVPFAMYANDDSVKVGQEFVVFITKPRKDLEDTYSKATSTIQTVPANAILTP